MMQGTVINKLEKSMLFLTKKSNFANLKFINEHLIIINDYLNTLNTCIPFMEEEHIGSSSRCHHPDHPTHVGNPWTKIPQRQPAINTLDS